jgi:hypothetical protein
MPAFSTAARILDCISSARRTKRTSAFSVARFTSAETTPGVFINAFSTRETHEAQVIPDTARLSRSSGTA